MSDETPPPPLPPPTEGEIPDAPSGMVRRDRLAALAGRVGPSLDAMHKHPVMAWILISGVIVAVAAGTFLSLVKAVVHARAEIVVPDLTGKTLEQALDAISTVDLSLAKQAVEFNDSFPPGSIIKQAPPPGLKVREGKVLQVTLSSGGQVVFVPDLTNMPLTEAQNQIRAAGLLLGALTEAPSQTHERGWVMEQTPTPGAVLNRGQMIDLRVSKGPPTEGTVLMPDFMNQHMSRAMEWAKEKGFKPRVREEVRPDALQGIVLSQTPAPDAPLSNSTPVEFVVSRSTITAANARTIRYDIPAGTERVQVRIVLRDERGEREVFEGYQNAGSLVEVPVVPRGLSRARIFVNGVLIEERVLE